MRLTDKWFIEVAGPNQSGEQKMFSQRKYGDVQSALAKAREIQQLWGYRDVKVRYEAGLISSLRRRMKKGAKKR